MFKGLVHNEHRVDADWLHAPKNKLCGLGAGVFFSFASTLLAVLLLTSSALGSEDSLYLSFLLEQARAQNLADKPMWKVLLHYKPRLIFPGEKSLVDDPMFFLSPDGKTNAEAELQATINAFFKEGEKEEEHPMCRYPARRLWLEKELSIDKSRLPSYSCRGYLEWKKELNPEGLTLIFPSAYLNNPASMFGHTFLRIDGSDVKDGQYGLLGYVASFGAATNETSGLVFAVRGLAGGYRGVFTVEPYYKRVKKYNDLENRDIWEYKIEATSYQIDFLMAHLWELQHVYFDYYFFDENCSYHMLSLLDVLTPEAPLSEEFPTWVIPIDTVRVMSLRKDLLSSAKYRASNITVLSRLVDELSLSEQNLALDIAAGKVDLEEQAYKKLGLDTKVLVLETAYEYLNLKRLTGKSSDEENRRAYRLLVQRSKLGTKFSSPGKLDISPPARPENGHATSRISLGAGYEGSRWYQQVSARPAYHDLLDPELGYVRGAQIEFFSAVFRHYEQDRLELDSFRPLNIVSLSPRNRLFSPISWSLETVIKRKRSDKKLGKLSYSIGGGPGISYQLSNRLLFYVLSEGGAELGPDFSEEKWSLSIGGSTGVYADLSPRMRLMLGGRSLRHGLGELYTESEVQAAARLSLSQNWSLQAGITRNGEFGSWRTDTLVSLQHFF